MRLSRQRRAVASALFCLLLIEATARGATIGPGSGVVLANPPMVLPLATSSLEVHRISTLLAAGNYSVNSFSFHNVTQSGSPSPGSIVPFLALLTDQGSESTTGPTRSYQTIWVGPPVAVSNVATLDDPANVVSVTYTASQQFSLPTGTDVYAGLYSTGAARVAFRHAIPSAFAARVDHDTAFSLLTSAGQPVGGFSDTFENALYAFQIDVSLAGVAPPVPGDFDGDRDVDGADFVAWQTNFPGASGKTLATGDADGDGDVDGADFVAWQTHFPTSGAGATAPVPEPAAVILLSAAAAAAAWSWRRAG